MRSTVVLFIGMGFGFMDVVGLVVRKEGETLNLISKKKLFLGAKALLYVGETENSTITDNQLSRFNPELKVIPVKKRNSVNVVMKSTEFSVKNLRLTSAANAVKRPMFRAYHERFKAEHIPKGFVRE